MNCLNSAALRRNTFLGRQTDKCRETDFFLKRRERLVRVAIGGFTSIHWIDRLDQEGERFERSEYDPAGHMVSTITQVKGELVDHWRDRNWHKPSTSAGLCEHFKKPFLSDLEPMAR
jgi:hypothetical protein